jgi:hypothetical protein
MLVSTPSIIHPRDPRVTDPREVDRLSTQCLKMIRLMRARVRVPNRELARIALKYTSRISDIRGAGFLVVCTPDPARDGLTWYTLRDPRWEPTRGYSITVGNESRAVVAIRKDDQGRRWVLYRTARRMGVTRVLVTTWRRWAMQAPADGKKRSMRLWNSRTLLAEFSPSRDRKAS